MRLPSFIQAHSVA